MKGLSSNGATFIQNAKRSRNIPFLGPLPWRYVLNNKSVRAVVRNHACDGGRVHTVSVQATPLHKVKKGLLNSESYLTHCSNPLLLGKSLRSCLFYTARVNYYFPASPHHIQCHVKINSVMYDKWLNESHHSCQNFSMAVIPNVVRPFLLCGAMRTDVCYVIAIYQFCVHYRIAEVWESVVRHACRK